MSPTNKDNNANQLQSPGQTPEASAGIPAWFYILIGAVMSPLLTTIVLVLSGVIKEDPCRTSDCLDFQAELTIFLLTWGVPMILVGAFIGFIISELVTTSGTGQSDAQSQEPDSQNHVATAADDQQAGWRPDPQD